MRHFFPCFRLVTGRARILLFVLGFTASNYLSAQNDSCGNASIVSIPSSGFATGIFTSSTSDMSSATVQTGESFAPAILVAGQTQKSIWYKFSLPTNRSVRVTLAQNGSAIQAGDIGFAVYKTNSCLPTVAQISTKLTPIGLFGSTYHPCVDAGDYLVQVSAKAVANGPVYVTVEIQNTVAAYDKQAAAYQFGTLAAPGFIRFVDYSVDCQSIENAAEVCTSLYNYQDYNKSTWHTFTTPAFFDLFSVLVSGTGSPSYFNGSTLNEKFGYNLYKGNGRVIPFSSLELVDGCDSLLSNGYYPDRKVYTCGQLEPNTTYTVQLFFRKDLLTNVRVAVAFEGTAPTQAPEQVSILLPASNKFGTLSSSPGGITTTFTDQLSCNSRHALHPCNPAVPASGIRFGGLNYNLSTFFTFTLSGSSRIAINASDFYPPYRYYSTPLLIRLYNQDLSANCTSLDTANLLLPPFLSNSGMSLDCVPAGTYTIQVSGRDTLPPNNYYYYGHLTSTSNYILGLRADLGKNFTLSVNVQSRIGSNKFDLRNPGAFDTLRAVGGLMLPLVNLTPYPSKADTFGCLNTVLPIDTSCSPTNTKAIYREFIVADSGIISITNNASLWHRLYKGDADALATSQNAHIFPSRISGLAAVSNCLSYVSECGGAKVCITPGTYTHASFGGDANIGQTSQPGFQFSKVSTVHNSPVNTEDMGTLTPGVNTLTSSVDYFSCLDNAISLNGYAPCSIAGRPATKAIYRQFYLAAASNITVTSTATYCGYYTNAFTTLFYGKITDSIGGLRPVASPFQCFSNATTNGSCAVLSPGWYTIVSSGSGPTYENPFQNLNQLGYGSYIGYPNQVTITAVPACAGPKYNRPFKASLDTITQQPYLLQWGPRVGHTPAYPKTDTTYALAKESFNCTEDTPFVSHPIPACATGQTKIAYYVFKTTQESFVQVDSKGLWAAVYAGNARTDSASFGATTLIQPCQQQPGYIQICKLQPGTYTLVVFANNVQNCTTVIPTIYIDQVGYSRFDHASNAYDFGLVATDSLYHKGKTGDVNPLNASRAPSNDFIYCTTGSRQSDPAEAACGLDFNAMIYNTGVNNFMYNGTPNATANPYNIARRNLWYTFTVDKGGYVHVKVVNKTIGKGYQYSFAVYKSNVDGSLPFSTVVSSGQVDSTAAQGLTFVGQSPYYYCSNRADEYTFYREPCSPIAERYYVVVDNTNSYPYEYPGMKPNSQVEVSVMVDSITAVLPRFDHYYQASNIGTNLGSGTYTGATDNFSCASRDATDPVYAYSSATCGKTLWYKFSTTVSGTVRFRAVIIGQGTNYYGVYNIQLFRENLPGDSTVAGLQILNQANPYIYDPAINGYWGQTCLAPGTYYILLPGCAQVNEYAYPQIKIIEQAGDFCTQPVSATLNGPGTNTSSVIVDCHTIGTDYGEFNPSLTCPNGAARGNYKTSWFKFDIAGTDTLDVTTYLSENTNALPSEIKYRLMNGNCGAMQERSCVQDAQTQDTYKCLAPGSYYIQVFTPVIKDGTSVTGTIDLHLSAVRHADTCAPIPPCLANANFIPQFECNSSDLTTFVNYSTYGSAISYQWNFGYNGQTSTGVTPQFKYPELATTQTYTVTLTVNNSSCATGNTATATANITIPGRPQVNIGNDTTYCTPGTTTLLNATTWPGATYLWQNGTTAPTFNATTSGTYNVQVTYNNCVKKDTIKINVNTILPLSQTKILCGNDSVLLSSARGQGETYHWNTGVTFSSIFASNPGFYTDTLKWNGCAILDSFRVLMPMPPFSKTDTTLCYPLQNFSLNGTSPGGISYLWQNGTTNPLLPITAPGQYWVKVNYPNCSIRDTIQVSVSAVPLGDTTAGFICNGQPFILPWGTTVTAPGVYRDTLHNQQGCDSIRKVVNVSGKPVLNVTSAAAICAGQTFTLPWGTVVTNAGTYADTLHYTSGCDSLRRTVDLVVKTVAAATIYPIICAGQNYTLVNGNTVSLSGIYLDTLRYGMGCDSLRRTVNLVVQSPQANTVNATLCPGQTFTLPWGIVVNSSGTYRDTLRYTTGCDSIRRTVNLVVQNATAQAASASICTGQTYTLPSGAVVSVAGTYRDTLRYTTGCDSLTRSLTLTVQKPAAIATTARICTGQNYTLPWGQVVNTSGTYRDTLHYATGCDSLQRAVTLIVQDAVSTAVNATTCAGQTFTLPWGTIVNSSGTYRDTLRYTTGCDSLRRTVNLVVQAPLASTQNASICAGQTFTLPWGTVVSNAGTYRDTLHFATGCDSLQRTVNLRVQIKNSITTQAVICAGQLYTLPWGTTVSSSGTYNNTLQYVSGCDSLSRTVNLVVQAAQQTFTNASICSGGLYTLPSGVVVNRAGLYRDTLRYVTGCDSVQRTINLALIPPVLNSKAVSICSDETFTLPWGPVVNTAGIYRDTVSGSFGCDSLVTMIDLRVRTKPVINLTKTNDVNCITGTAQLHVYGASAYVWSPATTLSNAFVSNPFAAPLATTSYKVVATATNGCTATDSIEVKMIMVNPLSGYLVPSSFTPNNDGLNDCFGVPYWANVSEFSFTVFNRWGEVVFQTTSVTQCWDGLYKNQPQPSAAYVYQIKANGVCGPVSRKGTVVLIR